MFVLLDTPEDLQTCADEMDHQEVGQLITPLTRRLYRRGRKWGGDNGGFKRVDVPGFKRMLVRMKPHRESCLFIAVPDVIESARRTLEVFEHWQPLLYGWPLALVCQDGQEDLPIPWKRIAAVFIGGSTEFKVGRHAKAIIQAAKAMGKWVHVGRVNTPGRFDWCEDLGVDSIDGTGIARYTHMREELRSVTDGLFKPMAIAAMEGSGT